MAITFKQCAIGERWNAVLIVFSLCATNSDDGVEINERLQAAKLIGATVNANGFFAGGPGYLFTYIQINGFLPMQPVYGPAGIVER